MTWSRRTWQYPSLIAFAVALAACTGEAGPKGDTGPQGAKGDPGATGETGATGAPGTDGKDAVTTGGLTGKVTDAVSGAGIADATVKAGDLEATTDAAGQYTFADIPIGAYQMTVAANGYNDGTATAAVASGATSTVNFNLSAVVVDNQPPTVALTEQHAVGYGTMVTVNANAEDPEAGTLTYAWTQLGGPAVTLTPSADGSSVSFTTAALTDVVTVGDRFGMVGISVQGRGVYTLGVTVTDEKGAQATGTVTVTSGDAFPAIRNVPKGMPVYANSGHGGTNAWTCKTPANAACAAAVFSGGTTQTPKLTPDAEGTYTLAEGANTMAVTSASWRGSMDGLCQTCHKVGGFAPDNFTPWSNTAHSHFFENAMNGAFGPNFFPSMLEHGTVGYDPAVSNGGFDDVAMSEGWTPPATLASGGWDAMKAAHPLTAGMANVQCENCHGPQKAGNAFSAAHTDSYTTSKYESARVTYSASVCAQCHDQAPYANEFAEWSNGAHSNLALARLEGTFEMRGTTAGHCGRCHSAQGFVQFLPQLNAGNPGQLTVADATAAKKMGLVDALIQTPTCEACHDPHDATNPKQLRVYNDTAMLPAGFQAKGMGAGALCITCHNTRNGTEPTTGTFANCNPNGNTYLHEDGDSCGDTVNGPATGFSAPHSYAAQGDVFNGRNAYFAGAAGTPHLSKHASIEGTCAGCHMEYNPKGPHTFTIEAADKAEVCANCHGATSGEGLQAQVEDLLANLSNKMGNNLSATLNGVVNGGASYYLRAWDPVTDCYSTFCAAGTAPSNVTVSQLASKITFEENHGQIGLILTLPSNVSWQPVNGAGNCGAQISSNVLHVQLGSVRNTLSNTCNSAGALIVPATSPVVKAGWNYFLFEGDSSKGIHNPSFTVDTLWKTIQAVP
ncbi:MAG: cytochrome c3 family protein [Polyangiaceae bacterium]